MFSNFLFKNSQDKERKELASIQRNSKDSEPPLYYNWIITNKLAIGPMPRTISHWVQLEDDGFSNRFSCCYPYEHVFSPIPMSWNTFEVSLPDHRAQFPLEKETLILAINKAEEMLNNHPGPLYLHCFAGQERSALIAIGLLCRLENKNLFDSIAFVRQCHPKAKPLYSQLDLLEQIIKEI